MCVCVWLNYVTSFIFLTRKEEDARYGLFFFFPVRRDLPRVTLVVV